MNENGLTLLELVLAISILAVVSVGATTLNLTSLRSAKSTHTDIELQSHLMDVFRMMNKDLRQGIIGLEFPLDTNGTYATSPYVSEDIDGEGKYWVGIVTYSDSGSEDTNREEYWYEYKPLTQTLRKWYCPETATSWNEISGGCEIVTISEGKLFPHEGDTPPLVFEKSDNDRRLEINLAVKKDIFGGKKETKTREMIKTIYLHGKAD